MILKSSLIMLPILFYTLVSSSRNLGEELVTSRQKPLKQSFSLHVSDIQLNGSFPLNAKNPFVIKGYDKFNKPYLLEIKTEEQKENLFKIEYSFVKGTHKSSGSIITLRDNTAKISQASDGKLEDLVFFETKITE